jgi:hypothetical protein
MNSSKKGVIALVIVFAVPVILAKLALEFEWFNRGATNKGELLNPILQLNEVDQPAEPKWRILYVLPSSCADECNNALFSLTQVWQALGKESDRAESLVISTELSDSSPMKDLEAHQLIRLLKTDSQSVNKVFKDTSTDGIFVVDTQGNIILRYPLQKEQQEAVLHSRDILADMRKLLKLSRIG